MKMTTTGDVVQHPADQQHGKQRQGQRGFRAPARSAEQRARSAIERPGLGQALTDDNEPQERDQRRIREAGQQVRRAQLVAAVGAGFGKHMERQEQQADDSQRRQLHLDPRGGVERERHRNGPKARTGPISPSIMPGTTP